MHVGALVRAYLARSACRAGAAVARRDIIGVSADFSAGAAIEAPLNARSGGLLGPSVVASRTVASPLALDHDLDELHPPAGHARMSTPMPHLQSSLIGGGTPPATRKRRRCIGSCASTSRRSSLDASRPASRCQASWWTRCATTSGAGCSRSGPCASRASTADETASWASRARGEGSARAAWGDA